MTRFNQAAVVNYLKVICLNVTPSRYATATLHPDNKINFTLNQEKLFMSANKYE